MCPVQRTLFCAYLSKYQSIICSRLLSTSANLSSQHPDNLKGKNVTSQAWLRRQINDPFVKKARVENYRCRSAFKLIEIDDKYKFLKPGSVVIDCGCAPGSWSQVAVKRVTDDSDSGLVIGVDLQHMNPVSGATILHQSDFTSVQTQKTIRELLTGRQADVVVSDMAPNATGIKSLDHELVIKLSVKALQFSLTVLGEGGHFLTKLWQGEHFHSYQQLVGNYFEKVHIVKPKASRMDSAEVFVLACRYVGNRK